MIAVNKQTSMDPAYDSRIVRKRFSILKKINELFREYNNLKGVRRVSTTDFESHYGEYLVASRLLNEGSRSQLLIERDLM